MPTNTDHDVFDARPASPLVPFQTRDDFQALSPTTQRALEALFDGRVNPRSKRARDVLGTATMQSQIDWPKFLTQLGLTVDVLKREPGLPTLPNLHPVTIEKHALVAAGKRIPVTGDPKKMADFLKAIPPAVLKHLDGIHIHDEPCEYDAFYSQKYGVPVLAAMANGSQGELQVYPEAWKQDRQTMIKNVLHEVGHTWSTRLFGDDETDPGWDVWKEAVREDGMGPSYYGDVNVMEDAAESFLLYYVTRGTPQFDEYQRMMPNRFAFMHKSLGAA